ncbi:MAG: hypothetical protein JWO38_6129 [Gemmataceae bacterium]|nr:hypothetical protein [Gemmataceae bacterium]
MLSLAPSGVNAPGSAPLLPEDVFPDVGMGYSAWLAREQAAGRPTRPGPNWRAITPGYQFSSNDGRPVSRGRHRRLAARVAELEDLVVEMLAARAGGSGGR